MKFQKKNLLVLALAGVVSVLMVGACDTGSETTTDTTSAVNTATVKDATLWKKADVGSGKVTEIVKSGTNTYAATSDKGLFYLKSDGTWAAVDLATGKQPGAATVKTLAGNTTITHLTALANNRVIFAATGGAVGAVGIGIAEGDKVTSAWLNADAATTNLPLAAAITSIAAIVGNNNKENIVIASGANTLVANFGSADADLTNPWNASLKSNGAGAAGFAKAIKTLVVSNDGATLFAGQSANPQGYYSIAKAEIKNGGVSAEAADAQAVKGKAGQTWIDTVLPPHAAFTSKGLVVDTGAAVAFVPTANLNGGDNTKLFDATVNRFRKGAKGIHVLATTGALLVKDDGTQDTAATFDGDFKGDNYEWMSATDLAGKKKADLKHAKLGTKDIKDMLVDGKTSYYVAGDALWVGKTSDIVVKKD